jgi:quinol monooxygenase YgiN
LTATTSWPIVELRQYALRPSKRDVLIELFDRELVESQEALGMKVIGQFRALDDPNRFVWIRGFPDMPTRARALEAFYDGPVWRQHSDAANATMIDSDDVLLLRPASPGSGFVLDGERPPLGSERIPDGLVVATIYYPEAADVAEFAAFFESAVAPLLADAGASSLAVLVTEDSPNNFPRLPIREGEHVLVAFAAFAGESAYERHRATLAETALWKDRAGELARRLRRDPEVLRLRPTARSQFAGPARV